MPQMKKSELYAVILAGGQSSRLFPFNKVLSDLTGTGKSLIQQSFNRARLAPKENIFVLTTRDMVPPIRRQLPLPVSRFFVDPVRRGTWPALLWAMGHLRQKNPMAVMAVMTGDHVIQGEASFAHAFRDAVSKAESRTAIVMLGIPPVNNPEDWRGFGCFRADSAGRVTEFCEKPTIERAHQMIAEGAWQWNSGMFFFRISTAEEALKNYQPEMFRVYEAMTAKLAAGKKAEAASLFEDFDVKIPHPLDPGRYVDNSIDYAIMTPLVARASGTLVASAVCNTRFRWTDLGQWDALRKVVKHDRKGNVRIGKTAGKGDVRQSILVAEAGYRIEASGLRDVVVAYGRKTALVLHASQIAKVKEAALEALKHPDRVVMEHDVTNCQIRASGGRVIAIGLSNLCIELTPKRLRLWRPEPEAI
jgi:mannose-1-phosphate guanylyltransferase